jgi:cytochrome c peroxidase
LRGWRGRRCRAAASDHDCDPAPTPAPTPTPTPTPPATPAGVADFTTIDFANVANYALPALPIYFDQTVTALDNTPAGNAIDNRIATLGRVLFHDRRLSTNDTTACASCHQQQFGFTDNRRFSTGISGTAFTSAHAMRLGNVRYWQPGSMFWDRRAATLELQASQPIINPIEMGWDATAGGIPALITKMEATTYYPDLFAWAFGTSAITEARIQLAIAQFQRAMISSNSLWDTGYAQVFAANAPNRNLNVDLPNFNAQQNRGRQLFMTGPGQGGAGCSACHQPPTFSLAANSRSNGLDAGETRSFKSPSLRSAGLTGPYMHDGRFNTLAEVVDFYADSVQDGPALDNRLRGPGGNPLRLNLNAADRAALVAFMQALTDNSLTTDARFSNPFRK